MEDAFALALAAHRAGDLDTAKRLYPAALPAQPVKAAHNLGVIHLHRGELGEAERYLSEALDRGNLPDTRYSLAKALLAQGRYREGWPLYEARRQIAALGITAGLPGVREWKGEDLAGKRIAVLGEQGFGDQIMFGRFLATLRDLGAAPSYVCGSALAPLYPQSADAPDYWILAGSLPLRLGVELHNLPPPGPFPPATEGQGVGVVPSGRPTHQSDAHRSLFGSDERELLTLGQDLRPTATGALNFADTARIVAGLVLVISVDTAVAHLAASLGKPTWLLLSSRDTDWRWLREREDSPWYPSARLFRQGPSEPWAAVLERVRAAL